MLDLEIQHGEREAEIRRLSKGQPVSIGRHGSNDICIDEPEVAPIHCRVSWNGSRFEVASANRDGVDLNGTLVRHAALRAGDILRVGTADLIVRDDDDGGVDGGDGDHRERARAAARDRHTADPAVDDDLAAPLVVDRDYRQSGEIPLKPVTEETPAAREGWERRVLRAEDWGRGRHSTSHDPGNPNAVPARGGGIPPIPDAGANDDPEFESNVPILLRNPGRKGADDSFAVRLAQKMAERQVRPGEQEALRSPFILGMAALALALTLAAGAIYLVIGRESTDEEFAAAVAEYDAKRYSQAADLFAKFVQAHGRDRRAAEAQYRAWNARVLKEIGGSSPAWKRGLEAVEKYVEANRDRKDFHDHYAELADFLAQIALGAAHSAEASHEREPLDTSSSAETMVARFSPDGKIPPELAGRIRAAFTKAQESIIEHERFLAAVAQIEQANKDRQPMAALAARRKVLALYPGLAGDARLASLLQKSLSVEQSLVARDDLNKPAVPRATAAATSPGNVAAAGVPLPHVTLTLHTRSRTDEPAGTRPVLVLAKDCCYGVDHVTGEPVWRRVIGLDTPFFPISVATSRPGVLLFDTNRLAIDLISRRTGELVWEQPIHEAVSGAPLVDQGQIYLATLGNHLYKIDLETGRIATRLTFSQRILSPPALARNRERLIVAGDASLVYTLSTSPLECIRVTDLGHQAGTLVDGVTQMGSLVLLIESGQPSGTRLHVLEARSDENWLKPLKVEPVEGQVRDAPVIYGKMLFVASVPARISAFSVADGSGQEALVPTSSMPIPKQEESPLFLSAGPDGQLWMAGSSLRRLQLKLNAQSFALDPAEIAVGISSQPLQVVGQNLFAARHLPYASSVFFSLVERESMVGQWRTVFGSSIIGHLVGSGGEIVTIGEAGEVFLVEPSTFNRGEKGERFQQSAAATLAVKAGTKSPLRATSLDDGRIAVDCGAPAPTLWLVTSGGQIAGSFGLDQPLEAGPVRIGSGIVLPLPGRLRLVSPTTGLSAAEELIAPIERGKAARWVSVARLGENDLLAADSHGRLTRVQFRLEPRRHLVEVRAKQLDRPIDVPLAVAGTRAAFADAGGTLHILDAATFDSLYSTPLPAPAIGLWTVDSGGAATNGQPALLTLETRDHRLQSYTLGEKPKLQFSVSLGTTGPSGPPHILDGRLVVANRDGTLLALDPSSGKMVARISVGQPLSGGVIAAGSQAVVASIDGTLYRIDSLLEPPKKTP